MSDSEEEDYDDEEEEDEEGSEEGEEEEEDEEALKAAKVKEDINMLMDVFGYIDRTSKRLASRLDSESLSSNRGAGGGGNKAAAHTPGQHGNIFRSSAAWEGTGGKRIQGGGELGDSDGGEEGGHELNGGWSQYEHMGDAERGLLLEKAILALGINDSAGSQVNDRGQYQADGNADDGGSGDRRAGQGQGPRNRGR